MQSGLEEAQALADALSQARQADSGISQTAEPRAAEKPNCNEPHQRDTVSSSSAAAQEAQAHKANEELEARKAAVARCLICVTFLSCLLCGQSWQSNAQCMRLYRSSPAFVWCRSRQQAQEARRQKLLADEDSRKSVEAVGRSRREAQEARRLKTIQQEEVRQTAQAEARHNRIPIKFRLMMLA